MTAILLPDIDRATLEDLKSRIPSLSEIELPRMEELGRRADDALDRVTGRSRGPSVPWIAAGLGLLAIVGAAAAFMTMGRRMPWQRDDRWMDDMGTGTGSMAGGMPAASDVTIGVATYGTTETGMGGAGLGTYGTGIDDAGTGLSAAEQSLMSTDPTSDADR